MAKVKQRVTVTKKRTKKVGGSSGYRQCNMCHGTGRVKVKKKS